MPQTTFACLPAYPCSTLSDNLSPAALSSIRPQTICDDRDGGGVTPPPTGGGLVIPEYN